MCSSDTLTDVSSLHDLDDDVVTEDDASSQRTQSITDDDCDRLDVAADSLSDVTIPDFTVSFPTMYVFQFLVCLPSLIVCNSGWLLAGLVPWYTERLVAGRYDDSCVCSLICA